MKWLSSIQVSWLCPYCGVVVMHYDYVIAGAGTAGCVLANRLSANPDINVLLLEAGGHDNYFWINIPAGYLYTIGNPRTDWCYQTDPDSGLNGRTLNYARGKVLGGCSSINAMIYMRGQRVDYDYWAQLGNRGWSWNEVLPVFMKSENYQHGADQWHGVGGELRVEERRVNWEILDVWREAAAEYGIPKINEFNQGNNLGNAYFQMNQRRGVRWSAAKAFLRPAMKRPNLTVVTDALVERVCLSADHGQWRATGIQARVKAQGKQDFYARKEVILTAGAIGSPQLLQLSGIGPGQLLQDKAIAVNSDLPGVGENLHDHLQIRTVYTVENTVTLNQRMNSLAGKVAMALEYWLFKTGPLTMPPSQLGAFAKSNVNEQSANIEWHVQPLSLDKFGGPLHKFNAITPAVCNLRPTSRGRIQIQSPDPAMAPSILLNYLATQEDRRVAVEGLKITRQIMAAQALARFNPKEYLPGPQIQSTEALVKAAGDLGTTIFHPVGSCKMGQDSLSVVNDRLQVHGVAGLRVADASIMPRIISGNTHAPVIMIAEQCADFVLKNLL